MVPKRVTPATKRVLPGAKNGPSKSSPMRTAEEPYLVLDCTIVSKSVVLVHDLKASLFTHPRLREASLVVLQPKRTHIVGQRHRVRT